MLYFYRTWKLHVSGNVNSLSLIYTELLRTETAETVTRIKLSKSSIVAVTFFSSSLNWLCIHSHVLPVPGNVIFQLPHQRATHAFLVPTFIPWFSPITTPITHNSTHSSSPQQHNWQHHCCSFSLIDFYSHCYFPYTSNSIGTIWRENCLQFAVLAPFLRHLTLKTICN